MILPSPTASVGSVQHLRSWTADDIPPSSAVLCRTNAPLIAVAFALLRSNHACYINGKDIASQLVTQLRKFKATSLPDLRSSVARWANDEVTRLESARRFSKAAAVEDRASCLLLFINKAQSGPEEVPLLINELFSPKSGGTVLSTIHKAKGLEWTNVFILDAPTLMPPRWASGEWQLEQEKNLHYVAATRAKENLFYINQDDMK